MGRAAILVLDMVDDDDGRRTDDGACQNCKLTYESKDSGELKRRVTQLSLLFHVEVTLN